MGSVSQSTRGVFFWLLLLCVVVDVHTAVVVTATSPFSAHVRRHTIGVTIDRGVFFCLLLVRVSAVVYHTYCCSSHCYITVFGPCSRAHDRCHNRPQCVFLPPPRVCRSKRTACSSQRFVTVFGPCLRAHERKYLQMTGHFLHFHSSAFAFKRR